MIKIDQHNLEKKIIAFSRILVLCFSYYAHLKTFYQITNWKYHLLRKNHPLIRLLLKCCFSSASFHGKDE